MLPVIESPSPQVESSLPRAPSEPSCQVSTAGGDAGAQASDETSPTKERGSQRRLFRSVDQQIDTSLSNVQPPDQRTAGAKAATVEVVAATAACLSAEDAPSAEAWIEPWSPTAAGQAVEGLKADMTSTKPVTLRGELAEYGLTEEGVMARMNEAGVESVEAFKMHCLKEFMSKQERETAADDDLTTIKAKTMY